MLGGEGICWFCAGLAIVVVHGREARCVKVLFPRSRGSTLVFEEATMFSEDMTCSDCGETFFLSLEAFRE
jgi:hypothetical protein